MNQKTVKALRKHLQYHPRKTLIERPDGSFMKHDSERKYITFQSGWRLQQKFKFDDAGNVSMEAVPVESYQTMYDDQQRKLYKSLKKKYINPNANQMTHFKYEESETKETE